MGCTSMNEASSRSHAICTVMLRQALPPTGALTAPVSSGGAGAGGADTPWVDAWPAPDADARPGTPGMAWTGAEQPLGALMAKMHLVDLAGSERTKRTMSHAHLAKAASASLPWMAAGAAAARFREAVNINQVASAGRSAPLVCTVVASRGQRKGPLCEQHVHHHGMACSLPVRA